MNEHALDLWARIHDALTTELHEPGATGYDVVDALELASAAATVAVRETFAGDFHHAQAEAARDRIARLLEPVPI